MYFYYLFSSLYIRDTDDYLSVETSRSQERCIEYVRSVRRGEDDDPGVLPESVHLDKQLVQRLLTLIVSAAKACSSCSSYSVDLIDKYDTRRCLLCLVEQVSYSGSSDSYEHLHKVRSAYRIERYSGFTCHGSRNICLSCSRRTYEKDPLWYPCSDILIFSRILEEVDYLLKLFFFFFEPCYVSERDLLLVSLVQLGFAPAELEGFSVPSLVHHYVEQEAKRYHHDEGRKKREERAI